MSPRWPRASHPWRALVEWFARTPVDHGPTGSTGRQPKPGMWIRGRSTASDPSGAAALEEAPVAPPPIVPPVEPAPATTTGSRKHSEPPADVNPPPLTRQPVVLLPHAQT